MAIINRREVANLPGRPVNVQLPLFSPHGPALHLFKKTRLQHVGLRPMFASSGRLKQLLEPRGNPEADGDGLFC
jgi:hypothetical protein